MFKAADVRFHCRGCFNPETWDFQGGEEWTAETQEEFLKLIEPPYINRVTLLGGEPLAPVNYFALATLVRNIKIRRPDIKIWIYTGYTYHEIIKESLERKTGYLRYILQNTDVLVAGRFVEELKDISLPFCGSSNQELIAMKESLYKGEKFLFDLK